MLPDYAAPVSKAATSKKPRLVESESTLSERNTRGGVHDGSKRRGPYARGIERKRRLLHAVLRLVAREGVAAVTHRAVADEAAVSLRATTYYFATKQEMIREALRDYAAASVARVDAVADRLPIHGSKITRAVDAIASVMLEEMNDPDAVATEYELILAISREPSYAPEYQELQRTLEIRLRDLFESMGSREPLRHARLVLATTRGLQVEHLASPHAPMSERTVKSLIRTLVEALIPEVDEVGSAAPS
jgi:TetR/AcrR family transcriptional regulator, regulator of biofilm formation and stress response